MKLYALSLSLGPALVSRLAQNMGLSRPNVYKVIAGLEKKGLAQFSEQKGYNKRFIVESPSRAIEMFREKQKSLGALDQNVTLAMPDLLALWKQGELPTKIKIIQEREHMMEAFAQVFEESKDEIIFLGSVDDLNHLVGFARLEKHIKRRISRGVRTKLLVFPGEGTELFQKRDKQELRETRVLRNLAPFVTSFYLFANKAILWQPKAPLAVLIEDEYIVAMLKSIFDRLWKEEPSSRSFDVPRE